MIKTSFAVCGFRVLVDGNENRASVIDVLDDFHVQQFPVVLPRLSALWVLTRGAADPAQVEGEVTVMLNGTRLNAVSLNIGFGSETRARAVIALTDVRVDAPGELAFSFQFKGAAHPPTEIAVNVRAVAAPTRQ